MSENAKTHPQQPTKAEVDKALEEKRLRRERRACYPCSSRKVRCNRAQPCETCIQRGHPEICIPSSRHPPLRVRRQRSRPRNNNGEPAQGDSISPVAMSPGPGDRLSSTESASPEDTEVSEIADGSSRQTYVGDDSIPSFVNATSSTGDVTSRLDMRPTLGLENTRDTYPYMRPGVPVDLAKDVDALVPSHADVLKYSQYYQSIVYPFYPLVADTRKLESLVCTYLELSSARESRGTRIFNNPVAQSDLASTSLILAVLASGVQFSDQSARERRHLSQEFARRAFHCARLANFLLRPTVEIVQAMLVLGHVLQNDGQADASWAFLGTTVRLAQCLGLHTMPANNGDTLQGRAKEGNMTWLAISWQDCLLSLCFDRPVATYGSGEEAPNMLLPREGNWTYMDCMFRMQDIGRQLLDCPRPRRANLDTILFHLEQLRESTTKGLRHLLDISACSGRRDRMEHHAFRLQIAFATSFICRPALLITATPGREDDHAAILLIAKQSLVDTLKAFLDLQALTVLPLRTWSMVHASLSAALLLQLLGETRTSPEVGALQSGLIQALSKEHNTEGLDSSFGRPWLPLSHLRALRVLSGTVVKRQPPSVLSESTHQGSPTFAPLANHQEKNVDLPGTAQALPDVNFFSQAEMAELSMDNFGNIDWGWDMASGGPSEGSAAQQLWGL